MLVLLLISLMFAAAQPGVRILPPQIEVIEVRDARDMPADHFYLIEKAGRLDAATRADYFARLENYTNETLDCSNPGKLRWYLWMAQRTWNAMEVRAKTSAEMEALILENPDCFLSGVQHFPFESGKGEIFYYFVFNPLHHEVKTLTAALQPALAKAVFRDLADDFAERREFYEQQLAREAARTEQRLAAEHKQYRESLQNATFLAGSPTEYWRRWEVLTREARDCEPVEDVAFILEAAADHAENATARQRNAVFIEALVMNDPACVLRGMAEISGEESIIDHYLIETVFHTPEELHAALTHAPAHDAYDYLRKRYEREYAQYRKQISAAVTNANEFLWSVKHARSDADGRIYVPATYIKGHSVFQEKLDALWKKTPDAGIRSQFDRKVKILPLDALDFMTQHQFGTYYLMWIGRKGFEIVKARVVNSALTEWACGDVTSVLQLVPESREEWLPKAGAYRPWLVAIELRDDLALPQFTELDWKNDDYFHIGRLTWPAAGRSFDFSYRDALVGVQFAVTENQTGQRYYAREFSDRPCH